MKPPLFVRPLSEPELLALVRVSGRPMLSPCVAAKSCSRAIKGSVPPASPPAWAAPHRPSATPWGRSLPRDWPACVEPFPEIVEAAERAIRAEGIEPIRTPIRGGTDGSRLSEMGLPTPNLFTGGHEYHSVREWASVNDMASAAATIVRLADVWTHVGEVVAGGERPGRQLAGLGRRGDHARGRRRRSRSRTRDWSGATAPSR